jgi:drug/metabolite transporter (DMT)-like permease
LKKWEKGKTLPSKTFNMSAQQIKGTAICMIGVLILSPDALLLRMVSNLPNYTVLFIKFAISGLVFVCWITVESKCHLIRSFKNIGRLGILAGIILGVSDTLFTISIQTGSAPDSLVILASNPLFSVITSYIVFDEKIPLRTIATCLVCLQFCTIAYVHCATENNLMTFSKVCFGAIALVFVAGMDIKDSNMLSNLMALFSSITLGSYFSILRFVAIGSR